MTVTARTATLIINTKRAQFDALLRAKYASDVGQSAPARVLYLSNIGLLVYPEALRWASERAFKIGTTSNVLYVPENEWTQVLAALDKLYTSVKEADTPWKMANVLVGAITGLMPAGYQGVAPALPAPINTVAPAQTPTITTGSGAGADPVTGSLQTGGDNLDTSMLDSSTPVTTREDNVITLPVATNTGADHGPLVAALEAALSAQGVRGPIDPRCLDLLPLGVTAATAADVVAGPRGLQNAEFRACLESGGATFGMDPKLKMVGFAAAGLLGAFLLVKLAK